MMATSSNRLGTTVQTTGIAAALPAASSDPAYSFYQPQGGYGPVGNDQVARQQAEAAARRAASAARDAQRSARPSQGRLRITSESDLRDAQNQWIAAGMPQSGQLYSSLMAVSHARNDAIKSGKADPITGLPNERNRFLRPVDRVQEQQADQGGFQGSGMSFSQNQPQPQSYIHPQHNVQQTPDSPLPVYQDQFQSIPGQGYNPGDINSVYNNVYAPGTGYGMGLDPYQGFGMPTQPPAGYGQMGGKGGQGAVSPAMGNQLSGFYGNYQPNYTQPSTPLAGKGGSAQPANTGQMGGKGGQTGQMGGKGGQSGQTPAAPAAPVQRGGYAGYGG